MTNPDVGVVTSVQPLRVRVNGDRGDAPARALSDFTGASTAPADGGPGGTEVLVHFAQGQRFATRVSA